MKVSGGPIVLDVIDGEEMQKLASGFFQVLYDANPQSVGGKLPDEAIYSKR